MIHSLSDVKSKNVGLNTNIWQFAIVLEGAIIGQNCNINCHTFIENNVVIGNNVTIKSGVYVWDGITIGDDVFIGPNVTFVNDKYPRSKKYLKSPQITEIRNNATIGAGSIIMGGVVIEQYAMVGAGSLVTKNVPGFALVKGSPAVVSGWVDEEGNKLVLKKGKWHSNDGRIFVEENNLLRRI